jgi:hypothetical protein
MCAAKGLKSHGGVSAQVMSEFFHVPRDPMMERKGLRGEELIKGLGDGSRASE